MQLSWAFTPKEVEAVAALVEERLALGRRMVTGRLRNNVLGAPPVLDAEDLWLAHIMCLVTSQQRSGPGSPVDQFLTQVPFPVSLARCQQADDVAKLVYDGLVAVGGMRFTTKIPAQVAENFHILESGRWDELLQWRDRLLSQRALEPDPQHFQTETQAARFVAAVFNGVGPKQSRNFWQSVGLTRYSFVLDSRVLRWLRKHLDIPEGLLTPAGLGDEKYYMFISAMLMELCTSAGTLPCMFDAAVFDSFDEAEWETEIPW